MSAITNGISQSQINIYRNCPYAYYLSYIKGYEPMGFDPTVMEVGRRVHDAIDIYYRNLFLANGKEDEIFNNVYSILRESWDHMLDVEYLKKAYICLKNFAKLEAEETKKKDYIKPLSELDLRHERFRGKIDRFDLVKMIAGDFKTNTNAVVSYDYKMQAAIYSYLIEKEFGQKIKYFVFYFLYPNETRIIKTDNLKKILDNAKQYRNSITQSFEDNKFERKPRTKSTCKYCDYKFYCRRLNNVFI